MVKRQRFTAEFKREEVRLLDAGERPASEIAIDLGIRRNQLYKWKAEMIRSGELSFPGSGRKPADQDSEIVRLKRELTRVTAKQGSECTFRASLLRVFARAPDFRWPCAT